jgi:hypothetical protein
VGVAFDIRVDTDGPDVVFVQQRPQQARGVALR